MRAIEGASNSGVKSIASVTLIAVLAQQTDLAIFRSDALRNEPQPLEPRHQVLLEQEAVEVLGADGIGDGVPPDLVAVPAHLVPHVPDGAEARTLVARVHEVARLDREVLQIGALVRLHGRDRAAQREVS